MQARKIVVYIKQKFQKSKYYWAEINQKILSQFYLLAELFIGKYLSATKIAEYF